MTRPRRLQADERETFFREWFPLPRRDTTFGVEFEMHGVSREREEANIPEAVLSFTVTELREKPDPELVKKIVAQLEGIFKRLLTNEHAVAPHLDVWMQRPEQEEVDQLSGAPWRP